MPTSVWDSVLTEFNTAVVREMQQRQLQPNTPIRASWSLLIESKIKRVFERTGIPLIIYGCACTAAPGKVQPHLLQIDASDKIGFHSMLEAVDGPKLDVLVHSPGGFAEATETIVEEIRRKFGYVRFIVPSYAKSAATMMVMAGDEILIDEDGELGPIDPQMLTANGVTPAEAIKDQFQKAHDEIKDDPKKMQVWFPILQALGGGILVQCDNAILLSKELVAKWLAQYMFRADPDRTAKAQKVADYLGTHANFKTHGRRVKLEHLLPLDLRVQNLRADADLYARIWELHCALDIILANTPIYKIFYNSAGAGMVRQQAVQQGIQLRLQQPPVLPQAAPSPAIPVPLPGPT
ncbi:MAG: hypothetical protein WCE23_13805 [Candidatus Binatus sp.]|uniref:SDH family Clp fold serine proteinase n=1 Tax=Candidatus Binatus sp. TaxID=2811406 RepID=UPI003C7185C9